MKTKTPQKSKQASKTLQQIVQFRISALRYVSNRDNEKSKVTFALHKLDKKSEKIQSEIQSEINEKIQEKSVLLASVGKDGNLIENRFDVKEKQSENTTIRYSYTPAKKIELDQFISELRREYNEKVIEIEPFIVPLPDDFDMDYFDDFEGFIFDPLSDEEKMERFISKSGDESSKKEKKQGPTIEPLLN